MSNEVLVHINSDPQIKVILENSHLKKLIDNFKIFFKEQQPSYKLDELPKEEIIHLCNKYLEVAKKAKKLKDGKTFI